MYKNNSVLFVTAFKDLNRGEWGHGFTRSVDTYLKWFNNLTKLPIRLICFCDSIIEKRIHDEIGFFNTYPYDEQNTFLKFLDKEKEVMNSNYYKDLVKYRNDPETNKPGYNLVNHNKIIFIQKASNMFPGYSHYAWVDVGYIREEINESVSFDFNNLNDKITFAGFSIPRVEEIRTPQEYCFNPGNVIIQGSSFIIKKDDINWYFNEYYNMVIHYFNNNLVDDDQAIVLQIYKNNYSKFNIVVTSEWFTLLNIYKVPFSIDAVIPTCIKDINTLGNVISGLKKNITNLRNIYVVCNRDLSIHVHDSIFIDEAMFPFTMNDIIEIIFKTNSNNYCSNPGWFFQQLLKLYSFDIIKGISNNILIVDSETIFYNKYTPIKNNIVYYTASNEVNEHYRRHMKFLLPYMNIYSDKISGICHQMLFQTHVLQNMFDRVCHWFNQTFNINLPFWKIFLLVTIEHKCVYSEYDLYFNFMLHFHKNITRLTNEITWDLTAFIEENSDYTYLTAHSHIRGDTSLGKKMYYVKFD